ncbi:hypothetical protein NQD34_018065 [Periophthalmus magnuspinnatus]|nr:hypothetical protein NQD34_018065 [Periophthalmus magnuspinnatus]
MQNVLQNVLLLTVLYFSLLIHSLTVVFCACVCVCLTFTLPSTHIFPATRTRPTLSTFFKSVIHVGFGSVFPKFTIHPFSSLYFSHTLTFLLCLSIHPSLSLSDLFLSLSIYLSTTLSPFLS